METQIDSLRVLDTNQVVEFYSDLMDKQASQFTILISVLCGIVVLIIGATWWWNYRGAKQQILEETDKQRDTIKRLFKRSTVRMEEDLQKLIEKKMSAFSGTLHKEFEENKESVSKDIKKQQAELSRVFALHCQSTDAPFASSAWWYTAAKLYNECGVQHFCQISVNSGLEALRETVKKNIALDDFVDKLDDIISNINSLPDYFASQKKETKNLVNQLKSRIKSGKEVSTSS